MTQPILTAKAFDWLYAQLQAHRGQEHTATCNTKMPSTAYPNADYCNCKFVAVPIDVIADIVNLIEAVNNLVFQRSSDGEAWTMVKAMQELIHANAQFTSPRVIARPLLNTESTGRTNSQAEITSNTPKTKGDKSIELRCALRNRLLPMEQRKAFDLSWNDAEVKLLKILDSELAKLRLFQNHLGFLFDGTLMPKEIATKTENLGNTLAELCREEPNKLETADSTGVDPKVDDIIRNAMSCNGHPVDDFYIGFISEEEMLDAGRRIVRDILKDQKGKLDREACVHNVPYRWSCEECDTHDESGTQINDKNIPTSEEIAIGMKRLEEAALTPRFDNSDFENRNFNTYCVAVSLNKRKGSIYTHKVDLFINEAANIKQAEYMAISEAFKANPGFILGDAVSMEVVTRETEQVWEYVKDLAWGLQRKFYPEATDWQPLSNTMGVLSQIDNMTCGLIRESKGQPVPLSDWQQMEAENTRLRDVINSEIRECENEVRLINAKYDPSEYTTARTAEYLCTNYTARRDRLVKVLEANESSGTENPVNPNNAKSKEFSVTLDMKNQVICELLTQINQDVKSLSYLYSALNEGADRLSVAAYVKRAIEEIDTMISRHKTKFISKQQTWGNIGADVIKEETR